MNWRTVIGDTKIPFQINHSTQILSIGSCFSEAMGQRFADAKFSVSVNPFGILFNPLSIAKLFAVEELVDEHIITLNDLFYHLDVHSSIKDDTSIGLKNKLIEQKVLFDEQVNTADVVFVTLGTSFVYEFLLSQKVIANCHKLPAKQFTKRMLSVEEIVAPFTSLLFRYPNKKFVFTVSPVRHTKEGLSNNMLSKSILRVACGELVKLNNAHYFPSYEMMLDDLRDYRFYTNDLIHINKQGEDYIWEKLSETFFNQTTLNLMRQVEKVQRKISHRPFNSNTQSHLVFLEKTLKELTIFNDTLDYTNEIAFVNEQIDKISL
jgi:hypothetical protein